jgi:hypothetical protein
LFHFFIFIYKKYFASGFLFVVCKKKFYQTPLFLRRKKVCIKWYNLLFSITLGFVIPNSSNYSTRQRIFIMYSYVRIMFYFYMGDGGGDCGGSLGAAWRQWQLGSGSCGSLAAAAWWQQLGGGSGSAAAVAATAVAALQ